MSDHVGSDEIAEDVDKGREQRQKRRTDRGDPMPFDRGYDFEVYAGRVGSMDVLQERLRRLGPRECARQQCAVSLVAHSEAQILGHLRPRLLHRRAKGRDLRRAGGLALEQLASELSSRR